MAASIKILIPFIIVLPGIIAFVLYGNEIKDPDKAFPFLAEKVLPGGFKGIFYCGMFAAVMGSFNSVLHSASTIFSLDIYKRFLFKNVNDKSLVRVAKITIVLLAVFCCFWVPYIKDFKGVFIFMKKYWGCFSPSIVAVFIAGMISRKVPPIAAIIALLLNPILYLCLLVLFPEISFLNSIGMTFVVLSLLMALITLVFPMQRVFLIPEKFNVRFERNLVIFVWGIFLFTSVVALLIVFL